MKNVTITLDEETAQWARVWAARRNTSVSRLLGQVLAERMHQETGYEAAKNRFLAKAPRPLRENNRPYPERDSLYDRPRLIQCQSSSMHGSGQCAGSGA